MPRKSFRCATRMLALAIGRVAEPAPPAARGCRRAGHRARTSTAGRSWSCRGRDQHRHRRVVGVQLLGRRAHSGRALDQRVDQPAPPAHPVGQRRAVELHAFAGVDLPPGDTAAVVGVLRHQRLRQQPRAGKAALDRTRWRRLPGRRSQRTQASFGRTWRITLKWPGTYSSISETSSPMRASPRRSPGSCAGRLVHDRLARQCAGNGRRARRSSVLWAADRRAAVGAATAPALASSSSTISSSCAIARQLLGGAAELQALEPAISSLSFSIQVSRCSASCCVELDALLSASPCVSRDRLRACCSRQDDRAQRIRIIWRAAAS